MAHIPLTQAERALCFVPAAKQFERARELRAKLRSPRLALQTPVLVETVPVLVEPREVLVPFDIVSPSHFDFTTGFKSLPDMIAAMVEFSDVTGKRPICEPIDAYHFARAVDRWCGFAPGGVSVRSNTPEYMLPRRFYLQSMRKFSAWSFPKIARTIGFDHTTVIYACNLPDVDILLIKKGARVRAEVKERAYYQTRWSDKKDAELIRMKKIGMTRDEIASALSDGHTVASVHSRTRFLRRRGQL